MPGSRWLPIPIEAKMFTNLPEEGLTRAQAAMENAYINEADGHSRFPGLEEWLDIPNESGRVYLHDWRGDWVAATSTGNFYRIDDNANSEDVTGVPISGGKRVIFSKTDTDLLMAAGGQIIAFDGSETRVLSEDAPESTHVGYIDNYVVALENFSGRFQHSTPGVYDTWDALDTFSADGKPDDLTALLVTEFRELLMIGEQSVEQFERLPSGDTPFFRRWSVGQGISQPYSLVFADNGAWGLNEDLEFVRLSGQTSEPRSDDINLTLEGIDDFTDFWVGGYPDRPLNINGQRFILLQAPHATTPYDTKGLTLAYDFRSRRWFFLYGWDSDLGRPARWPGWSHWRKPGGNLTLVGGEGKIYKLTNDTYSNDGQPQRYYIRTAHLAELGEIRIDNLRMTIKRGTGSYTTNPQVSIRCTKDNRKIGRWKRKGLGLAGERDMVIEFGGFGCAHTWQFEIVVTDDSPIELRKVEAQVTQLGQ